MLAHTWHEVGSNNWSNRIKKENCHGGFSKPPEENKCCRAKHRRERMRLIGTPELKVRLCHISVQLLSAVFATTAPCVSNTVISSRTREDRVYLGGGAGEQDTFVNHTRPFLATHVHGVWMMNYEWQHVYWLLWLLHSSLIAPEVGSHFVFGVADKVQCKVLRMCSEDPALSAEVPSSSYLLHRCRMPKAFIA